MSALNKPFQREYALNATFMHMRKDIDVSIRMASARIGEYDGDEKVSREIFVTLAELHRIRKDLDRMQKELLQDV